MRRSGAPARYTENVSRQSIFASSGGHNVFLGAATMSTSALAATPWNGDVSALSKYVTLRYANGNALLYVKDAAGQFVHDATITGSEPTLATVLAHSLI